jgi:excisionase family DNA binding protein
MDITSDKETETMLTIKEVAALLHIHANTVRRWSDRGLIKSYQINSRGDRRFWQKDIAYFLNQMNSNLNDENGNHNSLP